MLPFTLPADYPRVQRVNNFQELVTTRFANGVNALCWQRKVAGDFAEVVRLLGPGEAITAVDDARLLTLPASAAGRAAITNLLADQRLLREHNLDPALNCIHGYPRDEALGPVATDVFSFHADSATSETDTWLCTYHGPASEGLRNEEARLRVDVPATRAEILKCFGGADDEAFRAYLSDHCFDLHYEPIPGARPFTFGLMNLWRISVAWPGSPVPPCIHRAPETFSGQPPRLLLIS
jgi:hypothetical protein